MPDRFYKRNREFLPPVTATGAPGGLNDGVPPPDATQMNRTLEYLRSDALRDNPAMAKRIFNSDAYAALAPRLHATTALDKEVNADAGTRR